MSTIRVLPERIASQIAAGEVVDRPASVVRELIDNSIDAGADRIFVRIDRGGKRLVRVSDNGAGMSRDDLLLCIERHATSKISSAEDLFSVKSFGFRGEAIPSVASVSRMKIVSRPSDQVAGYSLTVAGGKLGAIVETGAPAGTSVEVTDLFFNVPARRKFLRTVKTETDHIVDVVSRVVLPFPNIHFKLEDGAKTLMQFPPSEYILPRLSALLGRTVASSMVDTVERRQDLTVTAYLAPAGSTRSRGDRLFVYVNGRHIRDRLLTRAVMQGYGQRLMKGNYPQAVMFLEIEPSKVDVNVHPTKQEVRFHESRAVFDTVVSVVDGALARSGHVVPAVSPFPSRGFGSPAPRHEQVSEPAWEYTPGPVEDTPHTPVREPFEEPVAAQAALVIGQLGNTYVLCQEADGLCMVDQHAAHERIVYESLMNGIRDSHIEVQRLLIPLEIELSMKETRIAVEKGEELNRLGIELDHFGGTTFLLRAVPVLLEGVDWGPFLSELVAALEERHVEEDALVDKVVTVMACHGAVRAGYRMSHSEMAHLLGELEKTDVPTNCPHGRPVAVRFSYRELEKMFKRIV